MFLLELRLSKHGARPFTVDFIIKYSNYRYVLPRYVGLHINSDICKAQDKWLASEEQFRKTDLISAIVIVAGAPAKCGAILSLPCEKEVTL
jgi:hypothetical protein